MTVLEERRWKASLVAAGIDPRPFQSMKSLSDSTFLYDEELRAVVERTSQGLRFVVEAQAGEIRRIKELETAIIP